MCADMEVILPAEPVKAQVFSSAWPGREDEAPAEPRSTTARKLIVEFAMRESRGAAGRGSPRGSPSRGGRCIRSDREEGGAVGYGAGLEWPAGASPLAIPSHLL